jgi:uncharacterized membrane protein YhdT
MHTPRARRALRFCRAMCESVRVQRTCHGEEVTLSEESAGREGARPASAGTGATADEEARAAATRREVDRGWYWLLLLPLIGTLIPPFYNHDSPRVIGIPFFYWYQMVWIVLSVLCTVLVYRRTRGDR